MVYDKKLLRLTSDNGFSIVRKNHPRTTKIVHLNSQVLLHCVNVPNSYVVFARRGKNFGKVTVMFIQTNK